MTKRQARLFAYASTLIFAAIFIALTIHSHTRFPELTNEASMTPAVLAGKDVWHRGNCINCHTLMGEGAYYAPDLTKIAAQRGAAYLKAFMQDPSRFYSEQKHRRVMPKIDLTDQEIDQVIAFLDWVSRIDTAGWPPRPIIVAGTSIPGTDTGQPQRASAASDDPIARGEALFRATPPGCSACHSVAAGVQLAGPTMADVARRAAQTVASPDYKGGAKDAAGYIRESITQPSAHLVPGAIFSANGRSFMPDNYQQQLKPEQIDDLVAYLMTLK